MSSNKTFKFVLLSVLSALVIVMTVVPYTGYINYAGLIEITTLHIVVIVGSVALGWKYGAILGGVWGVSCFVRAFTNPAWVLFTNPLISVLPRIIVGVVAAAVFAGFKKLKLNSVVSSCIAAIAATLTNTVLVLSAIWIFGGMFDSYKAFYDLFKNIIGTIIGINGIIELAAAAIIVPVIYTAISKTLEKHK